MKGCDAENLVQANIELSN